LQVLEEEGFMNSVFAKQVYTGKTVVENTYLVFTEKGIVALSKNKKGTVLGEFQTLTPAFVDPHSHIGLARSGEPSSEAEANDHLDSILALPDALDSVQMDDSAFQDAVEMGVLYSCIVPGSGNIIGGLSAVIRNYAANSTDALIARAGVKAAFGYNPTTPKEWKGKRPTTRMGAIAVLRKMLDEVKQKEQRRRRARGSKREEITLSAEEQVIRDVLAGKTRVRAHVHKIDDIAALLRVVDEFKIRVTVEHAMDVHQPETFQELRKRKIPVTYGPIDAFAYKVELKHENWRNIRHLIVSRVDCGLMSDHPVTPARQLFFQTRWFVRSGFSKQQAVELVSRLVSRNNAEILGIDKVLGTLEKGKWASFVGWNGDPFDLTSYPVAVYGEGKLLYSA
jgi:imidazolonepropionase-like amidohydrolase